MKNFIKMVTEGSYEGSFDLNEVAAYHETIPEDPRTAPPVNQHTTVVLKSGAQFNIFGSIWEFRKVMDQFLEGL